MAVPRACSRSSIASPTAARSSASACSPANTLGYFGPYAHKLRRRENPSAHYLGCHAGRAIVAIESDGKIKSCPSLGGERNVGGNWRDHGFKAIWERAPEIGYTRSRGPRRAVGFLPRLLLREDLHGRLHLGERATDGPAPATTRTATIACWSSPSRACGERVEKVAVARGEPFDNALFRIVREHIDPTRRAEHGPLQIDEPRVSRAVEPDGAGYSISLSEPSGSG